MVSSKQVYPAPLSRRPTRIVDFMLEMYIFGCLLFPSSALPPPLFFKKKNVLAYALLSPTTTVRNPIELRPLNSKLFPCDASGSLRRNAPFPPCPPSSGIVRLDPSPCFPPRRHRRTLLGPGRTAVFFFLRNPPPPEPGPSSLSRGRGIWNQSNQESMLGKNKIVLPFFPSSRPIS